MGATQQGADATTGRWLTIPRTLCFVLNGNDVLLMKRSPHRRIFPNQYNGLGGHIESSEDPYTAAVREIKEESGLDVSNVKLRAIHNINAGESTGIMLFVFTAHSSSRAVIADEREGTLHWIDVKSLDQYDLVEDLPLLLPRILVMSEDTQPYFGYVSYDDDDNIRIQYANEE
ncbi:MAG: NUDIX domain-containing protein [Anaerolineaceae bacterium]|nr:NUDIX domain-containing protein [Anaerolineaceae bacterium]